MLISYHILSCPDCTVYSKLIRLLQKSGLLHPSNHFFILNHLQHVVCIVHTKQSIIALISMSFFLLSIPFSCLVLSLYVHYHILMFRVFVTLAGTRVLSLKPFSWTVFLRLLAYCTSFGGLDWWITPFHLFIFNCILSLYVNYLRGCGCE